MSVALEQYADGARRAFAEAISGVVVAAILAVLVASPLVPDSMKWLFGLLAAIPLLGLLAEMTIWGGFYTGGWVTGVLLLKDSGIIPPFEFALYLGVPAAIWGIRIYIWIRDR